MNAWSLVYEEFNPAQEALREALCTLGNGYFATRGTGPEAEADDVHYPGTYLAGGYNRLQTAIAGRVVENEDLVNFPNWLPLTFRLGDGNWFNLRAVEILSYRQELNLKTGVLLRTVRFRDRQGRKTQVTDRRVVHMGNPHLAALETTLTAENWSGRLEILSGLDGRVVNAGVERYRNLNNKHLEPVGTRAIGEQTIYLEVETNQSKIRMVQAASTQVFRDAELLQVERHTIEEPDYIAQQFGVDVTEGSEVRIEKVIALFSSRDRAVSECGQEAQEAVAEAPCFRDLLKSHAMAWEHLWRYFDIEIELSEPRKAERTALILRLHIFHLLQTISPHTIELDVGAPARGWHGESYRGHIFWDELFIFQFPNLRIPEMTRALLMYRYRRLNEARAAARKAGFRGAMYPWQSGSNGREESQELHLNPKSGRWLADHSRLQRHVNAAIAYNAWQYYQVTQDLQFLSFRGAEMILEIARFWASIATYNDDLGRYEIVGVMGPDEYHDSYPGAAEPGLNNNAYTNIMAVWGLCCALELLEILTEDRRQGLCERLDIREEEIKHWEEVSRRMRVVFHDDGIISQFEGYDRLEEFDWEAYRKKYGNIQRLDRILEAEGDTPNRYKVSKQADVLMLFYLFSAEELAKLLGRLGYRFEGAMIPRNIEYYLRRTSHGSSLDRFIHAWVLARSDRAGLSRAE